jgi:FAD/FMN-containing dehydrogenase
MVTRRQVNSFVALSASGLGLSACSEREPAVDDVSALNHTLVKRIEQPKSADEIAALLKATREAISIGGSKHSMGGQSLYPGSLHLDLLGLGRLIWLDLSTRRVRVQAGMRWRELQTLIDPHNLSVAVMQSYSNFTVGGSVSVNAHGRYRDSGALVASVRALQLVTANGETLELSRQQQPEVFFAVIGGYGLLGVISEVELSLAPNETIAREVLEMPLQDYPSYFASNGSSALLHNADLIPPSFDHVVAVNWRPSAQALTQKLRLVPEDMSYSSAQNEIWVASEFPVDAWTREKRMAALNQPAVVWRNYEASLDVDSLEPRTRRMSTYLLQEYFVPEAALVPFVRAASEILLRYRVNLLNISIRHATADVESMMSWAPVPVFSLVLYYKQRSNPVADQRSEVWAQALVELALSLRGTYYLPYRMHANVEQFRRAYPRWQQLKALKAKLDPDTRFRNLWFDKYFG